MNLFEMFTEQELPPEPTIIDALRDFLPIAVKHLQLDHIPKIRLVKEIEDTRQPTFGRFVNDDKVVYVVVKNRHPVDVLRTLAHELVHYQQGEEHRLEDDSWKTGSPIEDEANAEGGVIMRLFNQAHPRWMALEPIAIQESLGKSSLVAALAAALALGPAPASADEPSPAAQALGIYRKINKMQHYGQEGLESEARQELINILHSIQGKPNQSKILPIIKDMMKSKDNETLPVDDKELAPATQPGDSYR